MTNYKQHKRFKKQIENNQGKLYMQVYDLVHQALHTCVARDIVREFRYDEERKHQTYNSFLIITHIALENYALQQLWKLFDKKNSVFHIWHIVKKMPYPNLQTWLENEINKISEDIENLVAWRNNMVSHRSEIGCLDPQKFEDQFSNRMYHESNIIDFLIRFLAQLKFEMYRISPEKTINKITLELEGYREFIHRDKNKIMKVIH
jgi:hypothetical protein